ncbi:MAG: inorganic phosphate transporter [Gammaproteobacteria bacterium]|nr:MAG: inorganic phosphate transporter [Gammaproteobacteria bacterium]RLA15456.1 MAG: inorganic phosphate transporter [Gammaproteobacteria bacterium]RLA17563.1 MAG: inorganic phosphate transporter [Gammaproteobacteria bacterium]
MASNNLNDSVLATLPARRELLRTGAALLFIIGIVFFVGVGIKGSYLLVIAAMIGGYMAINIGANDVANNVGPAVGSGALTMAGAIVLAVIFEAAGSIIAGGDVVGTIKKGIIDPQMIGDSATFVWLMIAALLAGAIWLNVATALGAPVSTTHSIVGGVLGAGIAAGGLAIADWGQMGAIAASWIISPVLGGLIAAGFLYLVKRTITYQEDKLAAARRVVPLLVGLMAWTFSTYLLLKGLKKIWKVEFGSALLLGLVIAVVVYAVVRPIIAKATQTMRNDKGAINKLFTIPLIFAAGLLSFAHGANDVANAIGPLAAINDALLSGDIASKAAIPLWVMLIGAFGIALGLALYGPKLVRTVGSEITDLDQSRAFCIAMSAAITVIIASQFALPVSSTHIAVGAVFGVGFLREHVKAMYAKVIHEIELHHQGEDREQVEGFLYHFQLATLKEQKQMLQQLKERSSPARLAEIERLQLDSTYREHLVKRSAVTKIVAAWIITVPASGLLAALIFYAIRGAMLP